MLEAQSGLCKFEAGEALSKDPLDESNIGKAKFKAQRAREFKLVLDIFDDTLNPDGPKLLPLETIGANVT